VLKHAHLYGNSGAKPPTTLASNSALKTTTPTPRTIVNAPFNAQAPSSPTNGHQHVYFVATKSAHTIFRTPQQVLEYAFRDAPVTVTVTTLIRRAGIRILMRRPAVLIRISQTGRVDCV